MSEVKANHQANVVRITAESVRPHPDPETTELELIDIPNTAYQVVVRKGQFKVGDLGVFIQPDSVVPQTEPFKFIWDGNVGLDGTVPEKRRRITNRKFRKEWSEGLLLPLNDFPQLNLNLNVFNATPAGLKKLSFEGDDVSELLGITHYDPDSIAGTKADQSASPRHKNKYPKTFMGWLRWLWYKATGRGRRAEALLSVPFAIPTYDVDAFKNYKGAFDNYTGNVIVTEKIHGSNARFLFLGGIMYAGSKNQWKAPGNDVWHKALDQNPWIEDWCRSHEGFALYGEIVPTQGKWSYGCSKDQVKFFIFDVHTPDDGFLSYDHYDKYYLNTDPRIMDNRVPMLHYGPFDRDRIIALADGKSLVNGAGHIREGVVVLSTVETKVRGLGRLQLKIVSNEFLSKDK